jgi:hypothetical protein
VTIKISEGMVFKDSTASEFVPGGCSSAG